MKLLSIILYESPNQVTFFTSPSLTSIGTHYPVLTVASWICLITWLCTSTTTTRPELLQYLIWVVVLTNMCSCICSYTHQSLPAISATGSQLHSGNENLIPLSIPKHLMSSHCFQDKGWNLQGDLKGLMWLGLSPPLQHIGQHGPLCLLCSDTLSVHQTCQAPPTIGLGTCLRAFPNLTCLKTSSWTTPLNQLLS